MTDYSGALWIPSPHRNGGNRPRYIIIHGTASGLDYPPEATARDFQVNVPPTSTHYVVGSDGTVVQCVAEADAAWGNGVISQGADPWWKGDPNFYTISIEHAQNTTNTASLPDAERKASFALVADICQRHGIAGRPADATGGIIGHASIDPVNRRYCPGNYPWAQLWEALAVSSVGLVAGSFVLGNAPQASSWPWLTQNRITQRWNGASETGIDLGMVVGTPITALMDGTVRGAGVDATGAYLGIESVFNGQRICWYFQHLDQNLVQVGESVQAQQIVGYSGGQTSGGNHPATVGSTGPHIEVGINFPWGGGRNPDQIGPNYDPLPVLTYVAGGGNPASPAALADKISPAIAATTSSPGFTPLLQRLNDSMNADPWYAGEPWQQWIGSHAMMVSTRGLFVSFGLLVMLFVVFNYIKNKSGQVAQLAGAVEEVTG